MKKQNIAIIGVIAFVLAVAVGYALFSQTLTINGTATAKGSFDVQFTQVGQATSVGYTKVASESADLARISENGTTLTITVNKLDYPGAYVEIPVTIQNKGTIPAKLKEIVQTGLKDETGPIKVSYSGLAASETPINTNETQSMTIKVEWLPGVNTNTADGGVTFTIALEYEQITA